MPAAKKAAEAPEVGSPAWQRADYLRALDVEREQNAGNPERVKAIDAEIKRASKPVDRTASGPSDEA